MASAASRPVLSWAQTSTEAGGKSSGGAKPMPSPNKIVFKKEPILHLDIRDLDRLAGLAKYDQRNVVLPPDLLPRQPFLLYPPSAAIEFETIFRVSWRQP